MAAKDFGDVNLYALLGIEIDAEQTDIRKAYRKKALECHPDKNPDNPRAAELFHELAKALEILTDAKARTAYDNVLKAKRAAELRHKQLDSKRQKLKADLEQRERDALHKFQLAQQYTSVRKTDEEVLHEQLMRLRREGSKLLEAEQRFMREQLQQRLRAEEPPVVFDSAQHRIKIKWKADKKDVATNGGYTKESIINYLKKYGDIVAVVVSKRPGRAIVEFKTLDAAEMALAYEKGLLENPLQLSWVNTPPSTTGGKSSQSATSSPLDSENLVLRSLRQAEERKRLIKELEEEDRRREMIQSASD